jgi:hypothetical protein
VRDVATTSAGEAGGLGAGGRGTSEWRGLNHWGGCVAHAWAAPPMGGAGDGAWSTSIVESEEEESEEEERTPQGAVGLLVYTARRERPGRPGVQSDESTWEYKQVFHWGGGCRGGCRWGCLHEVWRSSSAKILPTPRGIREEAWAVSRGAGESNCGRAV